MSSAPGTAVIGAGVVGLLTAWQLRITGHAVTVFDPAPGSEASYAAAGMLAPISEVQYGQEQLWELMTASRARYPELLAELEYATTTPTGYRDTPTLLIAADPGDRDAVADLVAVQQQQGMDVSPLTGSSLRRREPGIAPGLAKAWEVPGDHQVDPRQLVASTMAALSADLDPEHFLQAGPPAEWVYGQVRRVEESASPVSGPGADQVAGSGPGAYVMWTENSTGPTGAASTEQASFDHIVLSPGLGYSGIEGLPEHHPLDLRPVHGDVLRLRLQPDQLLSGETHVIDAVLRAVVRGRSVYLVPRVAATSTPLPADRSAPSPVQRAAKTTGSYVSDTKTDVGGLVIGASSREDGLAGTHAGSVAELLEDAITILPAVRDMELTEITTRARPGTPDDRPYLGRLSGDVVVSTGYHRHGILLAPLAAQLTAGLVNGTLNEDQAELLELMRPDR